MLFSSYEEENQKLMAYHIHESPEWVYCFYTECIIKCKTLITNNKNINYFHYALIKKNEIFLPF